MGQVSQKQQSDTFKKLYSLIPQSFRKGVLPLGLSLLTKTILDLFSLALIVPFLLMLLDEDKAKATIPFSIDGKLPWMLAALVILIILKWLTRILLDRYQTKFILRLYAYFSKRLFKAYFDKGLLFIKQNNVSELAYKVNIICYSFCLNVLMPAISFITEAIITLLIFAVIFIVSPYSGLTILLAVTPAIILYMLLIKKKISEYGRKEVMSRAGIMHLLIDTFRGYPDMVVNELFDKQESKFEEMLQKVSDSRRDYNTAQQIPAGLMEISIILCLAILVILNAAGSIDIGLTLAFMGVAVLRVVPAIKNMIGCWSTIKNSKYVTETIVDGLYGYTDADEQNQSPVSLPTFNRLDVTDLSFNFEEGHELFEGLSFTVLKGEKLGIRGVSGAGKSTLFAILLGLYDIKSGNVSKTSIDGSEIDIHSWHHMIGYVPQDVYIFNASIAENIAIEKNFEKDAEGRPIIDDKTKQRLTECLESAQLKDWLDSLPEGVMTTIGDAGSKISGGQKQRIGIARALWKQPQLLFFDEATSSLDGETEASLTTYIQNLARERQDLTMLFISHRESLLEICDRTITIGL